jgi:hypothetical protein
MSEQVDIAAPRRTERGSPEPPTRWIRVTVVCVDGR